MATKTISVDLEAYDRLVKARRAPTESFSRVIKRAEWRKGRNTGAALLAALKRNQPLSESALNVIEEAKRRDQPPVNKWK